MKKLWFPAILALVLVGCSDDSSDSSSKSCEDQGKLTCADGSCHVACTEGTFDAATCSCKPAGKSCTDQGKLTCDNGSCHDTCTTGTFDAASCDCKTAGGQTCEDQGKLKCDNGNCHDVCTTGTFDAAKCECKAAGQSCEDQGKLKCDNGNCHDVCTEGTFDAAKCECKVVDPASCEAKGQISCKDSCYDPCLSDDQIFDDANCACREKTCEEMGKDTCNGACYDKCKGDVQRRDNCSCPCVDNSGCVATPEAPICNVSDGTCKASSCGDGIVFTPEVCDTALASSYAKTCAEAFPGKDWEDGGAPACSDDCKSLIAGTCVEVVPITCGNGKIDEGEQCDIGNDKTAGTADDVFSEDVSCSDVKGTTIEHWLTGADYKPVCSDACSLNVGTCQEDLCGNGVLDADEVCDLGRDNDSVVTSKECAAYDPKYKRGGSTKVSCTNSCKSWDDTQCIESDKSGIYWCQLMTETVAFNSEVNNATVTARYEIGRDITDNDFDVKMVLGAVDDFDGGMGGFITLTKNISKKTDSEGRKILEAELSVDDLNKVSPAFYSFGVKGSDEDVWSYCRVNYNGELDGINGKLSFCKADDSNLSTNTKCNEYRFGRATIEKKLVSTILGSWTWSQYKSGNACVNPFASEDVVVEGETLSLSSKFACEGKNCPSAKGTGSCKLVTDGNGAARVEYNQWKCNADEVYFTCEQCDSSCTGSNCKYCNENGVEVGKKSACDVPQKIVISDININGAFGINVDMNIQRYKATESPSVIDVRYVADDESTIIKKALQLASDTDPHAYTLKIDDGIVEGKSKLNIEMIPTQCSGTASYLIFGDVKITRSNNN